MTHAGIQAARVISKCENVPGLLDTLERLVVAVAAGVLDTEDLRAVRTSDDVKEAARALVELPSSRMAWTAARYERQAQQAGRATSA
jgi:uncharacterized membrane protein